MNFEDQEKAKDAIKQFDNTECNGRIINVTEFIPREQRDQTSVNKFNNLFVKNLPDEID